MTLAFGGRVGIPAQCIDGGKVKLSRYFSWGFTGNRYALWHRIIDDARVGQRQSILVGDVSVD